MSIIHDVEQGSKEWLALRLGIPTASNFHKIISPKTRKISAQARKYAFTLIAEAVLKRPMESLQGLEWIERGKELEPSARKQYEFTNEIKTRQVGFITTNDGRIGCSPDSLVEDIGMVEIKCPAPQTMIAYMVDGMDEEYMCQKMGQIFVAEREWSDLYAWHPDMPPATLRCYRDSKFCWDLKVALDEFNDMKDMMMEKVLKDGFFAERAHVMSVAEATYGDVAAADISNYVGEE